MPRCPNFLLKLGKLWGWYSTLSLAGEHELFWRCYEAEWKGLHGVRLEVSLLHPLDGWLGEWLSWGVRLSLVLKRHWWIVRGWRVMGSKGPEAQEHHSAQGNLCPTPRELLCNCWEGKKFFDLNAQESWAEEGLAIYLFEFFSKISFLISTYF